MKKIIEKIKNNKLEALTVATLLLISGIAHGYNMFHFPYFENDEGTYMSQAWSLLTQGRLAPYTYWYDHAPAGWILIALWVKLTGGFFTFGTSVNSGRVLMLVLHVASAYFLYYIAKKLTQSKLPGILAVLIFSLSPLGIYFQRRVLLDNIMVFWVLLSLAILLKDRLRLSQIILSAVTFGIGVLSKEYAVFFIPAFIYLIAVKPGVAHRSFAIAKWICVSGLIISTYFIYALLKGEFFPVGFLGNHTPHVSMLETFAFQIGRGNAVPFWNQNSIFMTNLREWITRDTLTVMLGIAATALGAILCFRIKALRIPIFLAILFWIFLLRGKEVIDFYIAPLIPLLALNIGIFVYLLSKFAAFEKKRETAVLFSIFTFFICAWLLFHPIGQYTKDETSAQIKATDWVKAHVPQNAYIAIDDYDYVDLHAKRFKGDTVYPNADWFWKIYYDPQVRNKYHNNWRKINYIMLSHEMLKQMGEGTQGFLKDAFKNSHIAADFRKGSTSYINLASYISTNGDWMAIFKLNSKKTILLDSSWKYYKANFIKSYGQVIDPQNNDATTSEGQSYALLRAVWQNDKTTFDGVWAWTKDHLEHRRQDKLFSWLWEKKGNTYVLGDSASASDADEDIALALLFAYKRWNNKEYLSLAGKVINDIWQQEVVKIRDRYYLTAGTSAGHKNGYIVNPSYLSPATYRIFTLADKRHPWNELSGSSYYLLSKLADMPGNSTHLPPNWVFINKSTGDIASPAKYVNNKDKNAYGFDAFRIMWRVALDAKWFKSKQAVKYLEKTKPFFVKEWRKEQGFASVYNLDGTRKTPYANLSTSSGPLSNLTVSDKKISGVLYKRLFEKKFNYNGGYWGNKNNYYDQNWAWFGTALYYNKLKNLWVMTKKS
ncbi:glycosyl hydrolase family 8 [Patescibacteria group bacterium]|nr:glycosyl hydrolase family 8 [Patescibacteria group bacterium]